MHIYMNIYLHIHHSCVLVSVHKRESPLFSLLHTSKGNPHFNISTERGLEGGDGAMRQKRDGKRDIVVSSYFFLFLHPLLLFAIHLGATVVVPTHLNRL